MAYIQYNDDPLKKRTSAAFANLCASQTSGKKTLRLVDKCFMVFNQAQTDAAYCALQNFIYPVDTQNSINFEVCAGETLVLFDNALETLSLVPAPNYWTGTGSENYPLGQGTEYIEPSGTYGPSSLPAYYLLANEKNYARGILLYVTYSSVDKGGNEVLIEDNKCLLNIWTGVSDPTIDPPMVMPLHSFYAHFANPITRDAHSLINRIELVNPSPVDEGGRGYSITATGLILFVKSNGSVSDCAC